MIRLFSAIVLGLVSMSCAHAQPAELPPVEDPAWIALNEYRGTWVSDEKSRPNGTTFHFRITFEPFDVRERALEAGVGQRVDRYLPRRKARADTWRYKPFAIVGRGPEWIVVFSAS